MTTRHIVRTGLALLATGALLTACTTGGDSPEDETEPRRSPTSSVDYLEEDADVWGTEEGGTPAIIGR